MAKESKHSRVVNNHGYSNEVIEAALNDIQMMENLFLAIVDAGPLSVCWNVLDHTPPKPVFRTTLTDDASIGFSSLEQAINTFMNRLCGLRTALTTNTDQILAPQERMLRDEILDAYLKKVEQEYVKATKQ